MKNKLILVLMVFSMVAIVHQALWAQLNTQEISNNSKNTLDAYENLKTYFQEAYQKFPELPDGLLEAISYNTTRLKHRKPNEAVKSCSGTPHVHGVMALVLDGNGFINNTIETVAAASSYSIDELRSSPRKNILGTAKYLALEGRKKHLSKTQIENWIPIIKAFMGIPDESEIAKFVKNDFAWIVLRSMKNGVTHQGIEFTRPNNLVVPESYFDSKTLDIFNQKVISLEIPADKRNTPLDADDEDVAMVVPDYSGATWVGSPCYSSRGGSAITDVVIHDMEGYFDYTVYTLFQSCNNVVSAHYCLRSSDGFIVQLVKESDKAWHIGNANPYAIGLEHEGFANDGSWYTNAMYNTSSALVRDIIQSGYGISASTCYNGPSNLSGQIDPQPASVRIKGHCHYPSSINTNYHWDPGPHWDWPRYYNLLNCPTTLNLTGSIATGTHQAKTKITANGVVAGTTTFKSPTIRFNAGFKTNSGVSFKTTNQSCTSSKPELPEGEVASETDHAAHKLEADHQDMETSLSVVPNPFQENAKVQFELEEDLNTTIMVMDARGQIVAKLLNGVFYKKGKHALEFNLTNVPNGYYYFVMQTAKDRKVVNVAIMK